MPPKKGQRGQFACFKITASTADGRGFGDDPNGVVDSMEAEWDNLKEKLDSNPEMAETMKQHFNAYIDGEEDLGDYLFGSFEDFADRIKLLDDEIKQSFTDELHTQGILDDGENN